MILLLVAVTLLDPSYSLSRGRHFCRIDIAIYITSVGLLGNFLSIAILFLFSQIAQDRPANMNMQKRLLVWNPVLKQVISRSRDTGPSQCLSKDAPCKVRCGIGRKCGLWFQELHIWCNFISFPASSFQNLYCVEFVVNHLRWNLWVGANIKEILVHNLQALFGWRVSTSIHVCWSGLEWNF